MNNIFELRKHILNQLDYKIIRFSNKAINADINICLEKIKKHLVI